ncbi:MAG: aminotransferase class I/II-fold pyridoxal phosphate-dependent enzyme, partial [Planctomycetes bacterium]|nr:aminotransferase class I/II-fold pyridoxal phosphate-dependent enzyme [Planctomycetota bacterium]
QLHASLVDHSGKICLIANPNNPSGTMVPVQDLVAFCKQWQGIVVVDEAYVDFAADEKQRAGLIPYIQELPNLIVLRTFSKSYSLAGARVGLLFANKDIIAQLNKVKDSYNVNAISQIIACESLADQNYHQELVSKSLRSRLIIEQRCAALGWTWPTSEANFILCDVGDQAENIYNQLKQRGILIRWWNSKQLKNCLRISTGCDEHIDFLFSQLESLLA